MREYEASAKTVEEAIEKGLQELGVSIGDVDVNVVEEGSKGLFGLFGSRMAKVRLTVKADREDPLGNLIAEDKPAPKAKKNVPEKKSAPKAEPKAEKEEKPAKPSSGAEKKQAPKAEKKPAVKEETAEEKSEPAQAPEEFRPMEKPEITMIPDDQLDADSAAGIAGAFLKEITRLMGVEVTVDMGTDPEGNVYGFMTGDTLGILIGRRGETLDALQYLTSLKVNRGRESYTSVTLDTENYRARREDTLIRLANRMANRASRTGRKVNLEPMNPYERRIIHYALQKNEQVVTHSEGEEPNRHVVIALKK